MERRMECLCKMDTNHAVRVALISGVVAEEMGLADEAVDQIEIAGLLHDVGKKDIPDDILAHPGTLNAAQRAIVEMHPQLGHSALARGFVPPASTSPHKNNALRV